MNEFFIGVAVVLALICVLIIVLPWCAMAVTEYFRWVDRVYTKWQERKDESISK